MAPGTRQTGGTEVRPARTEEYAVVGALVAAAYRDGGELSDSHDYAEVLRDVAGRARDSEVLVAVRGGRVVGSVTVIAAGTRDSEIARDGELEFRFLGVERSAWGTGVADALVDAVLEGAGTAGLDTAICVRAGNAAAERLYARHGFVRRPDRDWSPVPGIDLRCMVREWSGRRRRTAD